MKRCNRKSGENGAAVVEFALVLPFLILLLMGIIEFGLIFHNKQILTNASREGARAGIAYATDSDISSIVETYCDSRLIRFDTDVDPITTITPSPPRSYGQDLTVSVSYDYTFLIPDLLGFGPNMTLTTETIMKMEIIAGP